MNIISVLEQEQLRKDIPDFRPGDTVKVHVKATVNVSRSSKALLSVVKTAEFVKHSRFVVFLTASV